MAVTVDSCVATKGREGGIGVDLDHTSFAVHDALEWGKHLRRSLGATPIIGEVLAEFRYLLLHAGTPEQGARIELLEPTGPGFLQRILEKRGEGAHHLTFSVPNVGAAVEEARSLGLKVVGERYDHPPWREAFIMPDATHGVVIQLSQSERHYPNPEVLMRTRTRNIDELPSVYGATSPQWWTGIWDVEPSASAILGRTHLGSTDLAASQRLFGDFLGGSVNRTGDSIEFTWPSGAIQVDANPAPGVKGMSLHGSGLEPILIGSARLGDFG